MTDHAPPPQGPATADHPSVVEMSALLDRELAARQVALTTAHLETCFGCRHELERLTWAQQAVAGAGDPAPPPGASDRAVVAALFVTSLSLVAQAARDSAGSEATPLTPAVWPPTGAVAAEPESVTEEPSPRGRVPIAAAPGARTMPRPPGGRTGRQHAGARRRHGGFAARAAVAVLLLGALGGGLAAVLRSNHTSRPSAGVAPTTRSRITARPATTGPTVNGGPSTTTLPRGRPIAGAAVGSLELQLRAETGPASCAEKVARHLENVNGVLFFANPPAARSAVIAAVRTGATTACVNVGPAFATLWSGNITHLSVTAAQPAPAATTNAGSIVDVVIDVDPSAISSVADMMQAENGHEAIEVIAQGADLGTAVIAKGPVVALPVTRSVAAFLARQLEVR